jgi:hypothetical protein
MFRRLFAKELKREKMRKTFAFGFVAGLGLLIVAGIAASRLQKDPDQAKYQEELADATAVQPGVLTDQQRTHSNLYVEYRQRMAGRRISDLVAQASGKGLRDKILGIELLVGSRPASTRAITPEKYLAELAQTSDAVIRGRATKRVSQITEDDTFIFTDYEVTITEVLKNNASTLLDPNGIITVTRPGGKVVVDGVIVKVRDYCFEPLPINSHEIVLFLQSIPESGTYRTDSRGTGAFDLGGSSVRPLTKEEIPTGMLGDARSFLEAARAPSSK